MDKIAQGACVDDCLDCYRVYTGVPLGRLMAVPLHSRPRHILRAPNTVALERLT